MVLINGVKYACERCIRGHRVSTCTHTDQPLMMIKRKGRPSTQCSHCKDSRQLTNTHAACSCAKKTDPLLPNHSQGCPCMVGDHCTCTAKKKKQPGLKPPSSSSSPAIAGELPKFANIDAIVDSGNESGTNSAKNGTPVYDLPIQAKLASRIKAESGTTDNSSSSSIASNMNKLDIVKMRSVDDSMTRAIGAESLASAAPITSHTQPRVGEVSVSLDEIVNPYSEVDINHVLGDIPLPFMESGGLLDLFADIQTRPQADYETGTYDEVTPGSLEFSPSSQYGGKISPLDASAGGMFPLFPLVGTLSAKPTDLTRLTADYSRPPSEGVSTPYGSGFQSPKPSKSGYSTPNRSQSNQNLYGSNTSLSGSQHAAVHQLAHHHQHHNHHPSQARHNPHTSFYTQHDASAYPPHFHPYPVKPKRTLSVRSSTSVSSSHVGPNSPPAQPYQSRPVLIRIDSSDSLNTYSHGESDYGGRDSRNDLQQVYSVSTLGNANGIDSTLEDSARTFQQYNASLRATSVNDDSEGQHNSKNLSNPGSGAANENGGNTFVPYGTNASSEAKPSIPKSTSSFGQYNSNVASNATSDPTSNQYGLKDISDYSGFPSANMDVNSYMTFDFDDADANGLMGNGTGSAYFEAPTDGVIPDNNRTTAEFRSFNPSSNNLGLNVADNQYPGLDTESNPNLDLNLLDFMSSDNPNGLDIDFPSSGDMFLPAPPR
ncbi:hypothetical protein BABINDRAFT_161868 [Babjeviella inositovora NRRL Y-12698]|uniref:Copper-fist domain-containing protein n=1 Tax=Babjeviella inositovora NRRL Y-12698 TaxID=984486 RepID=A0A1E3QQX9_9ASCO|nr:uncharacterized protein BABINDRAFT_161868 [Babjeviella inositovora NRRL Y-12698]ODQ79472.1 hypothetical protein BABINDRAFT_161868 [Babjeviella inositovora NRRL Y-12698]